jgi:hypothetical protein
MEPVLALCRDGGMNEEAWQDKGGCHEWKPCNCKKCDKLAIATLRATKALAYAFKINTSLSKGFCGLAHLFACRAVTNTL